jgi:cyanate lyase
MSGNDPCLEVWMSRVECSEAILEAKKPKGVTFQDFGDRIGRHLVWTTAAIMRQATMDRQKPSD